MRFFGRKALTLTVALALAGTSGCGKQRVIVRGSLALGQDQSKLRGPKNPARVTPKGQLINLPHITEDGKLVYLPTSVDRRSVVGDMLVITFHRIDDGKDPTGKDIYSARVSRDGQYEVIGQDGKGIPPGKYRISVVVAAAFTNEDKLKGRFDQDNSPIEREVLKGVKEQEIIIDLSAP